MALRECLLSSRLAEDSVVESFVAKADKLVKAGRLVAEAEAIIKNEFINDQYARLNNELNGIKSQIKIPAGKITPRTIPDLAPIVAELAPAVSAPAETEAAPVDEDTAEREFTVSERQKKDKPEVARVKSSRRDMTQDEKREAIKNDIYELRNEGASTEEIGEILASMGYSDTAIDNALSDETLLSPEEQKQYEKTFKQKPDPKHVPNLERRISRISPDNTGETSRYSGAKTFAAAGFGAPGRKPEGERTTINQMVQANLDFIAELNEETGGQAVRTILNHLEFDQHKNKLAKQIPVDGPLGDVNVFSLVNSLYGYMQGLPLSESGLNPIEHKEYLKYLNNLSYALGRNLGQKLNTARIRHVARHAMADNLIDSTLSANERAAMEEFDEYLDRAINGDEKFTDAELAARERDLAREDDDAEFQAEQSSVLGAIMKLTEKISNLKQKEVSSEKSRSIAKSITLAEKKIKELITSIKCD